MRFAGYMRLLCVFFCMYFLASELLLSFCFISNITGETSIEDFENENPWFNQLVDDLTDENSEKENSEEESKEKSKEKDVEDDDEFSKELMFLSSYFIKVYSDHNFGLFRIKSKELQAIEIPPPEQVG